MEQITKERMAGAQNKINLAVLYFCYNREDHLKQSLPKIVKFKNELPLFVFCDGPRKEDKKQTQKVRDYLTKTLLHSKNCKLIFREKNLGLADNIISGVNYVFSLGYDTVTVLEDDCVPKSNYFDYMECALRYYFNFENVMHISAFGMPFKNKPIKDTYITPYPCSWGWGTWKNKWSGCNFNDKDYYDKVLSDQKLLKAFNWSGKSFSYLLKLQTKSEINSWLIRWYAHIFKTKGVCVWATDSKLKNVGFDGSGQHKVKYDIYNQKHNNNSNIYEFQDNTLIFNKNVIKQFRQFFMGPSLVDKFKTLLYLKTGLLFERLDKGSKYYEKK